MRAINRLSATFVAKKTEPGRYGDGGGLWLQIGPTGAKSWIFRYQMNGRARQMGLGSVDTFGLKEARERARAARQLVADGVDPIDAKHRKLAAAKAENAKAVTFDEAARRYIEAHQAGWKNQKHGAQWAATLKEYASPTIGALPVALIDTAHVMTILEPIWATKTETASRVRGRIEAVLDWSKARHYRDGENPARWRGHLDKLLPARSRVAKVRHHAALSYADLPAFAARIRANPFVSARALEFLVLTAARTGESIGAQWSEIDLDAALWTVPAERMKGGREHRVPLCDRAVSILNALPRDGAFVFPGGRKGKPLSNMAMLQLLRGMEGCENLTVHGFRSAFRDWVAEQTSFSGEVAEAALAHTIGDKVEAAYRRGDALEKRRELMAAWCAFVESGAQHDQQK